MTTTSWINACPHSDDATFRAWGLAMSDAMTAVGFIKSADTGQIDWATVARPSISSVAGYEIRYLNDSLHGTCPIYVKIEWGAGTTQVRPILYFTVGTSTDGAGTITGTAILARQAAGNNTSNGTTNDHLGMSCMVEGAFWLAWGLGGTAATPINAGFGIHRTCDPDGTPNANGAYFWYVGQSSAYIAGKHYYRAGASSVTAYAIKGLGDNARDSLTSGKNVYTLPALIYTNQPEPVVGLLGVFPYDFNLGDSFEQTVHGLVRTFQPLSFPRGYLNNFFRNSDGQNTSLTHACVWE